MTTQPAPTPAATDCGADNLTAVPFNNITIHLPPGRTAGAAIKQAAIDQGVEIEVSYLLSVVRRNGTSRQIGDADTVRVRPGIEFIAIPCDDNS